MKGSGLLFCMLLIWTPSLGLADDCKDKCQVMCVFPSTTCKFIIDSNVQASCLDDYKSCVVTCQMQCECQTKCKSRKSEEFNRCVDRCVVEKSNQDENQEQDDGVLQPDTISQTSLLLTGEQGHLT